MGPFIKLDAREKYKYFTNCNQSTRQDSTKFTQTVFMTMKRQHSKVSFFLTSDL